MSKFFKAFVRDERGVSALEYAVLAGIVAVALAGVATAFNTSVTSLFSGVMASMSSASAK